MMKRIPILLALILALFLPAALAEDAAPYTPGEVTETLFAEAFGRGDMLTLDMQFALMTGENAADLFGTDAETLSAIAEVLENSIFTVGAGKIEDGLRVTLKGDYTVDADCAVLSAALDLTKTGVALSGNFLPGEKITANWETLLALSGLGEEEIAAVMSLRDADIEALLAEVLASLEPLLDMAAQIAAPYGETILQHLSALPMVVNENVPAEAGYPAAATELQIQITEKAVGDLIIALANQLKQDATLCALLDALLAETGEALTTVQLCDAIIQTASEELTDETLPLNLFIGMDADGSLLYVNVSCEHADHSYSIISFISGMHEETGASLISFDMLMLTPEQAISDGFSLIAAYTVDDANRNICSTEVLFSAYADEQEVAAFSLYTDNALNPENPNGYNGLMAMTVDATDGYNPVSMGMDAGVYSLRTESGEELLVEGAFTAAAESQEIAAAFEGTLVTELAGSLPVSVMTESLQMPELGIAEWRETYTLTAAPQTEDEPLTVTALETAAPEELEALAGRAMERLEMTLTILSEILPPALTETAEEAPALAKA